MTIFLILRIGKNMRKNLLVLFCGSVILFNSAVSAYAQAIKGSPEYQEAMQAVSQGKYEEAFEAISPLIQNGRYRSAAMYEMGKIRLRQAESEMNSAINHFNEAADYMNDGLSNNGVSGSELPKALFDLGVLYYDQLKNYAMAREMFLRIVEGYPTYLAIDKVYFNLAECEEAMGMQDEAVGHYQKIISDFSYSSYVQASQGKVRSLSSGTSHAEEAIESQQRIAEDKSFTEEGGKANLDLGDMQAKAGKYKQAASAYRQAIRDADSQEEGVEAYKKLVNMLEEKQKDYKGAAEAIEEMLDAYPNAAGNEEMLYKLGQIYENDIDSMKKKIVDGQVRYRKSDENSRKAIEYYDSVTDKYPDSQVAADAYVHKGKLYEDLKEYSEAKAEYEKFIKEFPQHSDVPSIKQKIQELEGY